ncbi:MAG TPA: HAMP domain-containing sensor histidine kinase [Microlunatus sp.]|nr:HAMP domain-containing sensor histidine kinase [Microlunatus sp.]
MISRLADAVPPWARTVRVRLTLTYSGLLFGITALLLAGVYWALSRNLIAAPLDPVTVKRFTRGADGTITYRAGETFQAADLDSVQKAVNFTTLQTLREYSVIALVIMFGLSLAIGWWVAGRALRPVATITQTAQEITATDLSRRIEATGPPDELRTLADTIDSMLSRLDGAFAAERRLLADVSHELRNPVAAIQANVEAVLGNEQSSLEERHAAATVVTRATARMSRLLDDLLASARKRSTVFADVDVDLAALTRTAVAEHALRADERALRTDLRVASGPVVYADRISLERAVSNLLANAVRLAPTGSTITVGIGSRQGWAWIAVRDEGPGIPSDQRTRVFDRFHRGPDSAGSGLGLAIARQIVESHDGHLLLTDAAGPGSTFVIWLPERAIAGALERSADPPPGDPMA